MWTFSCGIWDLVPWPGIHPTSPAPRVQNLSCWAIREVSMYLFFFHLKNFFPRVSFPVRVFSFPNIIFTFKFMINFELTFVLEMRFRSRFFFVFLLPIDIQFLQHHLLKRVFFLYWIVLSFCENSVGHSCVGLFLGLLVCCIYLCVYKP